MTLYKCAGFSGLLAAVAALAGCPPAPIVPPQAAFSADLTFGRAPLLVTFTDESIAGSAPITGWLWDFGPGGVSTEQHPVHTFAAPGVYSVTLTVSSASGVNTIMRTGYIEVPGPPEPGFSANTLRGRAPLSVAFTNTTTPGTTREDVEITYLWDFGDGGQSGEEAPVHVYERGGTFTVSLTAFSEYGQKTARRASYIEVQPPIPPTAQFTATPRSGQTPLTVAFLDQSNPGSALITAWLWDFGNGQTSTAANPTVTFAQRGRFTVSLRVTSAAGVSTETKPEYIIVSGPPVRPSANFTAAPSRGVLPLAVQFTDTSDPGTDPITSWSWDFGNGFSSTQRNPTHTYIEPGMYTVALTVTSASGTSTIRRPELIEVISPNAPFADFNAAPRRGVAPLRVQFADASNPGDAPIEEWDWDFGDGGTGAVPSLAHTYTTPGVYDVSLAITTDHGESVSTKPAFIEVLAPLGAEFAADVTRGLAPLDVTFTDLSSAGLGSILSWTWNFGDGATSAAQHPTHRYTAPGIYTVSLAVLTTGGAISETKNAFIEVIEPVPPVAEFEAAPRTGSAPLKVTFTDTSEAGNGDDPEWKWAFGDGFQSDTQNPEHTYTAPGIYSVSLTLATSAGQSKETKLDYIRVTAPQLTFGGPGADQARAAVALPDGGFVVAGTLAVTGQPDTDAFLWALRADGGTAWSRTFRITANQRVNALVRTADGGYLLAGQNDLNQARPSAWALRTDAAGILVWQRSYPWSETMTDGAGSFTEYYDSQCWAALAVADGGFILSGDHGLQQPVDGLPFRHGFMIRTNGDGIETGRFRRSTWPNSSSLRALIEGPSNVYVSVGIYDLMSGVSVGNPVSASDGGDALLDLHRASDLMVVQSRLFGNGRVEIASGAATVPGGGYMLAGTSANLDGSDANVYVTRTTADAQRIWGRSYGGTGLDRAHAVIRTSTGRYLIVGETTSLGAAGYDLYALLIDADGNIVWERRTGGPQDDRAFAVIERPGGGFILVGETRSFGEGGSDGYVVRLSADGEVTDFP